MAKISFSKLTPNKIVEPKTINIGEETVTILQYLSIDEKSKLIEQVLASVFDDSGFASPVRLDIYFILYLIKYYTNINITDKMIESANKTYDSIIINGIDKIIKENIPQEELNNLQSMVYQCVNHIENYNTSLVGMMKTITSDYSATKMNVEELMATLDQPEKIGFVKDVLDKIG